MKLLIEIDTTQSEQDKVAFEKITKALVEVTELTEVEQEAEPVKEEEPAPEKPKRARKAKAEKPAEAEPVKEESEASTEMPFDKDVYEEPAKKEEPVVAEAPSEKEVAKVTSAEFSSLFASKRIYLKVDKGMEYDSYMSAFYDFVRDLCEPYGDRLPSHLNDEQRAKFVNEKFNGIEWNSTHDGFQVVPF